MSRPCPPVIAIDGPAASGKSTLGRELAARFGYDFLDTGMLYRAVTLAAIERGVPPDDAACAELLRQVRIEIQRGNPSRVLVDGTDVSNRLREPQVEEHVSLYSALPSVRAALLPLQRAFAAAGNAVLAGRDIGTVVLPNAPVKFFLEASPEARAARRSLQANSWGVVQDHAGAARDILRRDTIDASRELAPLQPAPDAVVIDTTDRPFDEVLALALEALGCAAS
ncbi:MAG: (d)CMP kinase [Dehalococcoidia bacterium]|nr:(d)CMP kinase [Dehalococcoidia bacterium]